MRIRTIKPEFWTDDELSAVSPEACLLAIALLNWADDEGFFRAHPRLVQTQLFPMRDLSHPIQDLLQELIDCGYIEVFRGTDGKPYGLIVNFSVHQVISRPKPSKISELIPKNDESRSDHGSIHDESMTDHGAIMEPSRIDPSGREGKGKEGKGKERKKSAGAHTPAPRAARKATRQAVEDPAMIRIGGLFRKRNPEVWPAEDIRRYRDAAPTAEEIDLVCRYYSARLREDSDLNYRRRSLETLLNNWSSEVGKAEKYAEAPHLHDQPLSLRQGNDHTVF